MSAKCHWRTSHGNVTGLSQMGAEPLGKGVELSRDLLPSARRIAMMANSADPVFAKSFLEQAHRAGAGTGSEIFVAMVRSPDELESAFATVVKETADALGLVSLRDGHKAAGISQCSEWRGLGVASRGARAAGSARGLV